MSGAVLEFQQLSADGDFGLRCLDNSVVNIIGQPRTSGKNVVKCKLTADVASNSLITSQQNINSSNTVGSVYEATGNSLFASAFTDNATNATHSLAFTTTGTVSNTTQTASMWLARGSGTNNRFVRITMGNSTTQSSITNGFFSDIDLQTGTAGTVTAVGNGTATSVSITPLGVGYVIRMTGKVSSGSATTSLLLNSCAVAGTPSYAGSTTQCFIYDHAAIVTTASISDTTFNVDTDTGWLSGDAVCVASTTRTAADCEIYPLNANAGTSSFTSALYPFNMGVTGSSFVSTHHGIAPVQAEIGLLTRNVKIRSTSNTLMSYVYCTALSTVTASWAEFVYLSAVVANKRGIEIDGGTVTNPKSFTYCSLHDIDNYGLYCNAPNITSLNVTFSNNVVWNSYAQGCVQINGAVANNDWTFDSNLIMKLSTYGIYLADLGGVCTNNTVAGSANFGFYLTATAMEVLGTFDGNTAHSGVGVGLMLATSGLQGIISNFTAWRNSNSGVSYGGSVNSDLVFTNLTLFGNSPSAAQGNFNINTGDTVTIRGGLIAGDTSFACAAGINVSISTMVQFNLSNVDMSGTGGIYAPHTSNDIYTGTQPTNWRGVFNNCKFGATNVFASKSLYWSKGSYLSFEKYNQTVGDHRTEMTYGQLRTDATIYNTAAPSMRMTPNNASNKLESAPLGRGMLVAVNSSKTVTVSAYVRKDTTYNGNQPRLIVRANPAVGINNDTVLATDTTTTLLVPTVWDVATAAIATLSGGNLVVTSTSTATEQGVRLASISAKTSGKYYWEVTLSTNISIGGNNGIGIGTTASTYTSMGTNSTTGNMAFASGNLYISGSAAGINIGTFSTGQIIGVAIDLDNRKVWFRKAPAGNWNNSGTDNPATNSGGIVVPAGTMVPFVTFNASGNIWTANFGATTFSGTVPSGFTSGWTTSAYAGTWNALSGTTIAATDAGAMEFIIDCDGTAGFINVDDWTASTT